MKTRLLTAFVLLALIALGFLFEPMRWLPVLLIMLLGVACVHELAAMVLRKDTVMSRRLGMLAVAAMVYLGWRGEPGAAIYVLGLTTVCAFVLRGRRDPIDGAWRDIGATLGGTLYIGLPLAVLADLFVRSAETRLWLLLLLAIIWTTDTMALVVGKRFGRVKLIPRLSPGKTWEGSLGGTCSALFPCLFFKALAPETFAGVHAIELLVASVVFSICTQVGDLAESLIKRDTGVKDSGTLLPGHGGALDRIDSILFTAVPFAAYLRIFQPELFT